MSEDYSEPHAITTFRDRKNNKKIVIESKCVGECESDGNSEFDLKTFGARRPTMSRRSEASYTDSRGSSLMSSCSCRYTNRDSRASIATRDACCCNRQRNGHTQGTCCCNAGLPPDNRGTTNSLYRVCRNCGSRYYIPAGLPHDLFYLPCGHTMSNAGVPHGAHCQAQPAAMSSVYLTPVAPLHGCTGSTPQPVQLTAAHHCPQHHHPPMQHFMDRPAHQVPIIHQQPMPRMANAGYAMNYVPAPPQIQGMITTTPGVIPYANPSMRSPALPGSPYMMVSPAIMGSPGMMPSPVIMGSPGSNNVAVPIVAKVGESHRSGKRNKSPAGNIQMNVPGHGFVNIPFTLHQK